MGAVVLAVWEQFQTWHRDERGTTALEYVMLVALFAAAVVTVVAALGDKITAVVG